LNQQVMSTPDLDKLHRENAIYLAVNLYEQNGLAPELYFQANLLFSPEGEVVLRYLRMISINSPSPYDFWDRYCDMVGLEGVFPVAETSIGRIGTIASEEILFPEIARVLALQGAELLIHCTSEVSSVSLTPKDIAKRARAIENGVYLVSANSASIIGTSVPPQSTDGMSKVVGPDGSVLAETGGGESFNAATVLDIEALRRRRARAAMTNLLPRLPGEAFAKFYAQAPTLKPNGLVGMPHARRAWLRERLRPLAEDLASGFKQRKEDA
jgi:predicted amidohydrolase